MHTSQFQIGTLGNLSCASGSQAATAYSQQAEHNNKCWAHEPTYHARKSRQSFAPVALAPLVPEAGAELLQQEAALSCWRRRGWVAAAGAETVVDRGRGRARRRDWRWAAVGLAETETETGTGRGARRSARADAIAMAVAAAMEREGGGGFARRFPR
jgi:hypothetical protein